MVFLPPDTARVAPRLDARNHRRALAVASHLRARNAWQREALRALRVTLRGLTGRARAAFLREAGTLAWIASAEEAVRLAAPPRRDEDLFELIARGSHLSEVVPRGRLDAAFRRRARSLATRLTEASWRRLPLVLAGWAPRGSRFGPFPVDPDADPEESRAAGEIHLRNPAPVTIRLDGPATLSLDGERVIVSPRWRGRLAIAPRRLMGSSGIVVARGVTAAPAGLSCSREDPDAARRLARGLELLGSVWPAGREEVLAHTQVVIPLSARGVVSYSMPDRPGISYINLEGKSRADLADDLLHETAHHRLHDLEALSALVRDDGEPRYVSPWRRAVRPLRGILHAAYTFTWRAELLRRMKAAGEGASRSWLERELAFESGALATALADLADASRRGLLTPAGDRLRRALASRVRALRR